ncbi:S2-RNase [Pyrus ussuriensis x Pyrus communis]|uniref:S2-RNase n=1 Tax=Pyrus ussuriensis x Pyrus communis TaxID=2448454 RepID=A0A5N5HWK2_9ROSA|nr:S2-RNase [Pyrus ussuriensis x Pyrus communis]
MESSTKKSQLTKVSPYNLPLMRVSSQEEGEAFLGLNIYADLSTLSDSQCPCTRIYPWFLDLEATKQFFFTSINYSSATSTANQGRHIQRSWVGKREPPSKKEVYVTALSQNDDPPPIVQRGPKE